MSENTLTIATETADAILATYGETDAMLGERVALVGAATLTLATEGKNGETKPASGATVYAAILASASDPNADAVAGFGRASTENAVTAYKIANARFSDRRANRSSDVGARVLRLIHAGRAAATERYIGETVADCKTANQRANAILAVDWFAARDRVKAIAADIKAENAAKRVKTETDGETETETAGSGATETATPGDAALAAIRSALAILATDGDRIDPAILAEIAAQAVALESLASDLAATVTALA